MLTYSLGKVAPALLSVGRGVPGEDLASGMPLRRGVLQCGSGESLGRALRTDVGCTRFIAVLGWEGPGVVEAAENTSCLHALPLRSEEFRQEGGEGHIGGCDPAGYPFPQMDRYIRKDRSEKGGFPMTSGCWRRLTRVLAVAFLFTLLGIFPCSVEAKTLGFVTFSGPGTHAEFTQRLVEEWAKENGHVIRSQVVPYVQLRDKIMVTMIARDPSVDFYYVDSGPYPLFAHGLAPLNDLIARDKVDHSAIAKPLLDLFTVDGKIHSIPHESDISLLVYREDLFSDATEQRNFRQKYGRNLAPPKTFDEMMQVAEFFTRKKGESLAGKLLDDSFYGVALSGRTYISTARLFQMDLHGYGARTFDGNLCPAFNGEGAQKALQFFVDLVNKGFAVPGVMTTGTPEIVVLMNEGRAAMSPTYPTGIGIGSRPGFRFKSAPWYPATEKAWGLAISELSKNKEEVWSLIKFMIQKETQMRFGLRSSGFGAEPTRSDVLRDPKLQAERPTLAAMAETHEHAIQQTNIPEMAYVWDIQAEPIADVLVNKMTIKAALDKAVGKVYKLLQDGGYYEGKPRCSNVP